MVDDGGGRVYVDTHANAMRCVYFIMCCGLFCVVCVCAPVPFCCLQVQGQTQGILIGAAGGDKNSSQPWLRE